MKCNVKKEVICDSTDPTSKTCQVKKWVKCAGFCKVKKQRRGVDEISHWIGDCQSQLCDIPFRGTTLGEFACDNVAQLA